MKKSLDEILKENLTEEKFKKSYLNYKELKKEMYSKKKKSKKDKESLKDKRSMGEEGISPKTYDNLFLNEDNIKYIISRLHKDKYLFKPLKEIEISKISGIPLKEAIKMKKIRTLSISSLKDVIVQKLIYDSILDFTEEKFKKFDGISYAYRPGNSAPDAARKVQKYMKDGYNIVINADLSKFFDTIPHHQLLTCLRKFYGEENNFLIKLLSRFIYSYRIEVKNYKKLEKRSKNKKIKRNIFHHKKIRRTKRIEGIPQGGVLSGILANIYLYDFDKYMKDKMKVEELKYIRYADDFIVFLKEESGVKEIFNELRKFLNNKGLTVHGLKEESKEKYSEIVNLNNKKSFIEYVGFKINPKYIRIKSDNRNAFKKKILEVIERNKDKDLRTIIKKINFKIVGNEEFIKKTICPLCKQPYCLKCGLPLKKRSWISYFSNITDTRELKILDKWIFNEINKNYRLRTNKYIKKAQLKEMKLKSIEREYYNYKKFIRKHKYTCKCQPNEAIFY